MEKFCVDLGVDPTEFIVLVLAWKFEASQMCRFTREEFMNGCQKMCAHDAKSLKERFPELCWKHVMERTSKNCTISHFPLVLITLQVRDRYQSTWPFLCGVLSSTRTNQRSSTDGLSFCSPVNPWDFSRHLEHVPTLREFN